MSKLHINIGSWGTPTTVSDMRRRLAHALAKLPGDTEVTFDFRAEMGHYEPAPKPLAVQCPRCGVGIDDDGDGNCGQCARRLTKNPILAAPYNFGNAVTPSNPYDSGGLWGYAASIGTGDNLTEGENVVHGPLAAPEND